MIQRNIKESIAYYSIIKIYYLYGESFKYNIPILISIAYTRYGNKYLNFI